MVQTSPPGGEKDGHKAVKNIGLRLIKRRDIIKVGHRSEKRQNRKPFFERRGVFGWGQRGEIGKITQ